MGSSKLALSEITETYQGYQFRDGDFQRAFVVLVENEVPGSIPHPTQGHLIGFSNICTHLGCGVSVKKEIVSNQAVAIAGPCGCHGTSFDLNRQGLVILGQATQNLPQLQLQLADGETTVEAFDWVKNPPELDISPEEEKWPLQV
jgi:arsenite oxidase small subunit